MGKSISVGSTKCNSLLIAIARAIFSNMGKEHKFVDETLQQMEFGFEAGD